MTSNCIISYLATFPGTDSLSVLTCREAVNQSINQHCLVALICETQFGHFLLQYYVLITHIAFHTFHAFHAFYPPPTTLSGIQQSAMTSPGATPDTDDRVPELVVADLQQGRAVGQLSTQHSARRVQLLRRLRATYIQPTYSGTRSRSSYVRTVDNHVVHY